MAAQKQLVRKIGVLPVEVITGKTMMLTRRDTMEIIAEESLNHFLEGFRKGGGQTDASKSGWKRRKNNVDPGRGILIGHAGGSMWRDVNVQMVTNDVIIIGTKRIPYAATHNEGLRIPRRNIDMPKREFIGPTKALEIANANTIAVEMGKPLKRKVA
ncbi:MAG: hypothetical protein KAR39_11065 [Thermoplasmata archaeon]|nr:hypothetical protein [Thermoplasmata archaeon]